VRTGRAVVGLSLLLGLALLAPNLSVLARLVGPAAVDPQVLSQTAGGKRTSVVVFLADQADVRGARGIANRSERGRTVQRELTDHAARSQAPLTRWLTARGVGFQSFWVANMLVLDADRGLVDALATRPDVARIDANAPVRGVEDPSIAQVALAPATVTAVEAGVANVRAPDMWTLGYTGAGIVIGDADTGVRWTHTDVKHAYRGWNGVSADHNYNWHDAVHSGGGVCGANTTAPCDDNGHGTHTVGTLVGDDGSTNKTGVAPGAKWIGCRNMNQGTGTPASYSECFQFFLAPTDLAGHNANPDLRPDIVSNSWACPVNEGCATGAELETIVNNLEAAGIFVVAAAGNYGPNCSTVEYPPGMYANAFTVGAIDGANNYLASFSSRGPSLYYTPGLRKPDLSAPGVNVRSAWRTSDTAYAFASGTSMATPHVAGVVALLWSARPELAGDVDATRAVLLAAANPAVTVDPPERCGGLNSWDVPNNSFGFGRIDAYAALSQPAPTPAPTATTAATPSPTPSAGPTVPGAPRSVVASAGDASAKVTWSAPLTNGGSSITAYTATSNPGGKTCTTGGALKCTVSGLVNGHSYTFTVRATNAVGTGPPSNESNSVTPRPPDTTAPVTATPTVRLLANQTVNASLTLRVSWPPASDPSGIARYDLFQSTNGGAWMQVSLATPTSTSVDRTLAIGKTYAFTVRATDGAGNTGGYATTATAKLARGEETSSAITYSGSWTRVSLSGASGGYVDKSTATAASATYAFTGSGVGFVSTRGAGRGIAQLWLDGAKVATIDLYAASVAPARLVWASGVLPNTTHTLQVRVTGTKNAAASNVRIDTDAFVRWT
jgi:subtilisin family serine protease